MEQCLGGNRRLMREADDQCHQPNMSGNPTNCTTQRHHPGIVISRLALISFFFHWLSHRLVFEPTWIPVLLVRCSFSASYTYTCYTYTSQFRASLTQPETSRHRKISDESEETGGVRNRDMAETWR